jgi:hypothetical protein
LGIGIKWVGLEVDHSPLSSAEVKNDKSCTPNHPVCLHYLFIQLNNCHKVMVVSARGIFHSIKIQVHGYYILDYYRVYSTLPHGSSSQPVFAGFFN